MIIARSVANVVRIHVVHEYEAVDRVNLNRTCKRREALGDALRVHRRVHRRIHSGQRLASTIAVAPAAEAFVHCIAPFLGSEGIDPITFDKGRAGNVTQMHVMKLKRNPGAL